MSETSCCMRNSRQPSYPVVSECCSREEDLTPFDREVRTVLLVLERLLFFALATYTAYRAPKMFSICFGVGVGTGLFFGPSRRENEDNLPNGCTQSWAERAAGKKLPVVYSAAANGLVAYVHLDHHLMAFGPIFAVLSGVFVGEGIAEILNIHPSRRLVRWLSPETQKYFT